MPRPQPRDRAEVLADLGERVTELEAAPRFRFATVASVSPVTVEYADGAQELADVRGTVDLGQPVVVLVGGGFTRPRII